MNECLIYIWCSRCKCDGDLWFSWETQALRHNEGYLTSCSDSQIQHRSAFMQITAPSMACEEGIVGNVSKDVSLLWVWQRQRQIALAEKRLPLGGWTRQLMLLNAEQTGAFILVDFLWSGNVKAKRCCLFWFSDLADLGRCFTKFQRKVEASGCKSHPETAGGL